jgi:hypothetical protein
MELALPAIFFAGLWLLAYFAGPEAYFGDKSNGRTDR